MNRNAQADFIAHHPAYQLEFCSSAERAMELLCRASTVLSANANRNELLSIGKMAGAVLYHQTNVPNFNSLALSANNYVPVEIDVINTASSLALNILSDQNNASAKDTILHSWEGKSTKAAPGVCFYKNKFHPITGKSSGTSGAKWLVFAKNVVRHPAALEAIATAYGTTIMTIEDPNQEKTRGGQIKIKVPVVDQQLVRYSMLLGGCIQNVLRAIVFCRTNGGGYFLSSGVAPAPAAAAASADVDVNPFAFAFASPAASASAAAGATGTAAASYKKRGQRAKAASASAATTNRPIKTKPKKGRASNRCFTTPASIYNNNNKIGTTFDSTSLWTNSDHSQVNLTQSAAASAASSQFAMGVEMGMGVDMVDMGMDVGLVFDDEDEEEEEEEEAGIASIHSHSHSHSHSHEAYGQDDCWPMLDMNDINRIDNPASYDESFSYVQHDYCNGRDRSSHFDFGRFGEAGGGRGRFGGVCHMRVEIGAEDAENVCESESESESEVAMAIMHSRAPAVSQLPQHPPVDYPLSISGRTSPMSGLVDSMSSVSFAVGGVDYLHHHDDAVDQHCASLPGALGCSGSGSGSGLHVLPVFADTGAYAYGATLMTITGANANDFAQTKVQAPTQAQAQAPTLFDFDDEFWENLDHIKTAPGGNYGNNMYCGQ